MKLSKLQKPLWLSPTKWSTNSVILVVAILSFGLIYWFFVVKDFVEATDQKITFLIAAFGLVFSVLKVWLDKDNAKENFKKNVRYEEYKKVRQLTHDFFQCLSEFMAIPAEPKTLEYRLAGIRNEISVIINTTNKSIYPNIIKNESVIQFGELSDKIVTSTSQYRYNLDKCKEKQDQGLDNYRYLVEIETLNWHNQTVKYLHELHKCKYGLFEFMEKTIIDK